MSAFSVSFAHVTDPVNGCPVLFCESGNSCARAEEIPVYEGNPHPIVEGPSHISRALCVIRASQYSGS